MQTTVVLKVKLTFEHDNGFSEEDIAWVDYAVYRALRNQADCDEVGLCPPDAEGYTEDVQTEVESVR